MNDLKIIKKKYGEEMMHFVRGNFATILEKKGVLSKLMLDSFYPNHELYNDLNSQDRLDDFKNYIYKLYEKEYGTCTTKNTGKSVIELLDDAGYELYECKSEEDIQSFRKYYANGEKLCTFQGGRLNSCHVFFAVKKDVDQIKREDFAHPKRQDKYGTSVISIQFTKDSSHTLSIKNRYNHTVINPDATFSNNLDNIIPGLTDAFSHDYGMTQEHENYDFEIYGYVKANDGKFYKYNYEIHNVYYCPDNIIIDNFEVKSFPRERYIVFDYFILDLKNKTIQLYDKIIRESFTCLFSNLTLEDIRIDVSITNGLKQITITDKNNKKMVITLDKENKMISYYDEITEVIEANFLEKNKFLIELELLNVHQVDHHCLSFNVGLEKVVMPKVKVISNSAFLWNAHLKELELPRVEQIGNHFLHSNERLEKVVMPKVKVIGDYFLCDKNKIKNLDLPEVREIGDYFLCLNESLLNVSMPKLKVLGGSAFYHNLAMTSLELPSVEEIGAYFLCLNESLFNVSLPKLKTIGNNFLYSNREIKKLELPSVEKIGNRFLEHNSCLMSVLMPRLKEIGDNAFNCNRGLKVLNLPNIRKIGDEFLTENQYLESLSMPIVEEIGRDAFHDNLSLMELELPNVKKVRSGFLNYNECLKKVFMPKLEQIGAVCSIIIEEYLKKQEKMRIRR